IAVAAIAAVAAVLIINWVPDILFAVTQATRAVARTVNDWLCACDTSTKTAVLRKLDFSALGVVASGYEASSIDRMASLRAGWAMFIDHPILGSGLGAFLQEYKSTSGAPLVIHSTPLWLLAETGI